MGLLGSSKSSTNVSNYTTNTDARVVGGEDSLVASIVGNDGPVSVTQTDLGAIGRSFDFAGRSLGSVDAAVDDSLKFAGETVNRGFSLALRGIEQSNQLTRETVAANGGLLRGALEMQAGQNEKALGVVQGLKESDVRVLSMVGLVVVGLAAVALVPKLKG